MKARRVLAQAAGPTGTPEERIRPGLICPRASRCQNIGLTPKPFITARMVRFGVLRLRTHDLTVGAYAPACSERAQAIVNSRGIGILRA